MSRHERSARAGVQWVGGERPGVHLLWRDRVLREGRRHELPLGDALVPAGGVKLGESVGESLGSLLLSSLSLYAYYYYSVSAVTRVTPG